MPILTDFDLDIPYPEKGVTPEVYEKTWNEKRIKFRDEIRCVASLYGRNFEKLKTEETRKILVECLDEINDSRVLDLLDVTVVQVQFNVDSFFLLNEKEKKETTFHLLNEGIKKIIDEKKWDSEPFEKAKQACLEVNFKNEWEWKKTASSPNRKYKASVKIEHDVEEARGYLLVRDKKQNLISSKEVFKTRPNEWIFDHFFGKIVWENNETVHLIDRKIIKVGELTIE